MGLLGVPRLVISGWLWATGPPTVSEAESTASEFPVPAGHAATGQQRAAAGSRPGTASTPPLELIKPRQARGKCISREESKQTCSWAEQAGGWESRESTSFQEASWMVPWWLPAREQWPVGSRPGASGGPSFLSPANRTGGVWPRAGDAVKQTEQWLEPKGPLVCTGNTNPNRPRATQAPHRAWARNTGRSTQTFGVTHCH